MSNYKQVLGFPNDSKFLAVIKVAEYAGWYFSDASYEITPRREAPTGMVLINISGKDPITHEVTNWGRFKFRAKDVYDRIGVTVVDTGHVNEGYLLARINGSLTKFDSTSDFSIIFNIVYSCDNEPPHNNISTLNSTKPGFKKNMPCTPDTGVDSDRSKHKRRGKNPQKPIEPPGAAGGGAGGARAGRGGTGTSTFLLKASFGHPVTHGIIVASRNDDQISDDGYPLGEAGRSGHLASVTKSIQWFNSRGITPAVFADGEGTFVNFAYYLLNLANNIAPGDTVTIVTQMHGFTTSTLFDHGWSDSNTLVKIDIPNDIIRLLCKCFYPGVRVVIITGQCDIGTQYAQPVDAQKFASAAESGPFDDIIPLPNIHTLVDDYGMDALFIDSLTGDVTAHKPQVPSSELYNAIIARIKDQSARNNTHVIHLSASSYGVQAHYEFNWECDQDQENEYTCRWNLSGGGIFIGSLFNTWLSSQAALGVYTSYPDHDPSQFDIHDFDYSELYLFKGLPFPWLRYNQDWCTEANVWYYDQTYHSPDDDFDESVPEIKSEPTCLIPNYEYITNLTWKDWFDLAKQMTTQREERDMPSIASAGGLDVNKDIAYGPFEYQ